MIEKDGIQYARVSQIISPLADFSMINPAVLANKARIGTNVHEAINDYLNESFPSISEDEFQYFKSFQAWHRTLQPIYQIKEARYFCPEKRITGQVDGVAKLGDQLILIDYKTSASESPSWIYQAHLYDYLLQVSGIETCGRYLFLKLDRNGKLPKVYEYKHTPRIHSECMDLISDFWNKYSILE